MIKARVDFMSLELLRMGQGSFERSVVDAFQQGRHTNKGQQPITLLNDVELSMHNLEVHTLSCLQINWVNIHSINTESSKILRETLPIAMIAACLVSNPPYFICAALCGKGDETG
jgi:hypothetical protein